MLNRLFKSRYCVLFSFIAVFLIASFLIRTILLFAAVPKTDFSTTGIFKLYLLGLEYDMGVALFLTAFYNIYLLLLPQRWSGSIADKILTCTWLFLVLLISFFSFFAELTFWQEFESRFNFIAVDYLIYTYEVIANINESYPLPLLISGMLMLVLLLMWLFYKLKVFHASFQSRMPFKKRIAFTAAMLAVTVSYPLLLSNSYAEQGNNRYQNELSKAGIYSFFAAFKNNELNYNDFYALIPSSKAYRLIREELKEPNSMFLQSGHAIKRMIKGSGSMYRPNVIMITVESLSADFMGHFGNTQNLTPALDSMAGKALLFTNMYATGTRTVRGMEALTLAVPPTPGSSIVRRPDNKDLTTIGHIFESKGYTRTFYYGGDGYFDNMNEYFGSNGFDITDRGRNLKINDSYKTRRTIITDKQVHFENAWGISDEDLFNAVIRAADKEAIKGKPFYNFVMTTSNHRPFTFPKGKIDLPTGKREGAVKYTDYAISGFLKKLQTRAWYKNTVIIIVADHCAGSAGKNEIDIAKYHIPCMVLNLPGNHNVVIDKMCSQIDIYPTLFSLLKWNYESNLYGKNVMDPGYQPRAVLGTYQKLAFLKQDSLVILAPHQKVETYIYHRNSNEQQPAKLAQHTVEMAKAYYQTAYDLFKSGSLHQ